MVLRRAAMESPKKVAALLDLVNLPTALREFAAGRSQMSHLTFFLGVWSHIKNNNLQDPTNRNIVNCDEKLKTVLLGRSKVELAELPMLVKLHFPKNFKAGAGMELLLSPGPPPAEAWHLAIWAAGRAGWFDLAWAAVRRMLRRGVLTRRAMVIVMERYAAANEVKKAVKTFDVMEKFKVEADQTVFYSLLRALCRSKNIEDAEELLLVRKKFFPLTAEGFNIVLDGWCNIITDVAEAKRVWREMSNCCISPDGTSYALMVSCFSKVGNLFDTLRVYDEMKKRG